MENVEQMIIGSARDAEIIVRRRDGKTIAIEITGAPSTYVAMKSILKMDHPSYVVEDYIDASGVIRENYTMDKLRATLYFDMNTKLYKRMIVWMSG